MNRKKKGVLGHGVMQILMIAFSILMLMPFFWIISTSLRLPKDSFNLPPSFFPTSFNWENYVKVFKIVPFFSFIMNSVKVAVVVTMVQSAVTTMAAYAFSRIRFKGSKVLFIVFLSAMMIPYQSIIIPQFLFVKMLGIIDTHWSLILPFLFNALGIFLVRQSMMTIPKSYDEAAHMDGAGRYRIYWNIILPMSVPAIIVVAIMSFINSWNNYFTPLIFISTWVKMTMPLGLTLLNGYMSTGSVATILAGVTMSIVPPLLLYVFGQKYLLRGNTLTGIKA